MFLALRSGCLRNGYAYSCINVTIFAPVDENTAIFLHFRHGNFFVVAFQVFGSVNGGTAVSFIRNRYDHRSKHI